MFANSTAVVLPLSTIVVDYLNPIYEHDVMNIGYRLKQTMIELDIKPVDLFKMSGVDEGNISAIILRDSKKTKHGPALARALGLNLEWLMTGEGARWLGKQELFRLNSLDYKDMDLIYKVATRLSDGTLSATNRALAINVLNMVAESPLSYEVTLEKDKKT